MRWTLPIGMLGMLAACSSTDLVFEPDDGGTSGSDNAGGSDRAGETAAGSGGGGATVGAGGATGGGGMAAPGSGGAAETGAGSGGASGGDESGGEPAGGGAAEPSAGDDATGTGGVSAGSDGRQSIPGGSGEKGCTPGARECSGNTALTCNAAGNGYEQEPCQGDTPLCHPDSGRCVQCLSVDDCLARAPVGPCEEVTCQLNQCVRSLKHGQACSAQGIAVGQCDQTRCVERCGDGTVQQALGEECDPARTNDWHCNPETCKVQGSETAYTPCSGHEDCLVCPGLLELESAAEADFERCAGYEICLASFCAPIGVSFAQCEETAPAPFEVMIGSGFGMFSCLVPCSSDTDCPSHTACGDDGDILADACIPPE